MVSKEKGVSYWAFEEQAFTFERINKRLLYVVILNTLATMIIFLKGIRK